MGRLHLIRRKRKKEKVLFRDKWFLALAGIYIFTRLLLLLFAIDGFSFFEEHHTGVLARDLIEGLRRPFLDYQDMYHSSEVLILGVIGVPYFLLFGKTLFALKLTSFTIHFLIFVFVFLILDRFFRRRAAVLAGVLLILAPPSIVRTSLIPIYQHSEAMVFFFITLYLSFAMINSDGKKRGLTALLGFFCGLGMLYSYTFFIGLVSLAVLFLTYGRGSLDARDIGLVALFFLLGFSPRIYQFAVQHSLIFCVDGHSIFHWFSVNSLGQSGQRLIHLVFQYLPESFFFKQPWLSNSYYLIFVISFIFLLRAEIVRIVSAKFLDSPGSCIFLLYTTLSVVVVGLSGFNLEMNPDGYRYVIPVHYVFIVIISLFLSGAGRISGRRSRVPEAVCAAAVFLIGTVNLVNLVSLGKWSDFGKGLDYRGYSDKVFDWLYAIKIAGVSVVDPEKLEEIKKPHTRVFSEQLVPTAVVFRLNRGQNERFCRWEAVRFIESWGICPHLQYGGLGKIGKLPLVESVPDKYHPYFYEIYGETLTHFLEVEKDFFWDKTKETYWMMLEEIIRVEGKHVPRHFLLVFYQGLGRGFNLSFTGTAGDLGYVLEMVQERYRHSFSLGLGRLIGWRYGDDLRKRVKLAEEVNPLYFPSIVLGMGVEYAYDLWLGCIELERLEKLACRLDPGARALIIEGVGMGARMIAVDDPGFARDLGERLEENDEASFQRGFSCSSDSGVDPFVRPPVREITPGDNIQKFSGDEN